MKRLTPFLLLAGSVCLLGNVQAADNDKAKTREAFKAINDFVGGYKGVGPTWTEEVNWKWKFKGDDRWLHLDIDKGKQFSAGDLRFLPDKKKFQLTLRTIDKTQMVFEGVYKDEILTLEYVDPDTKKVTHRIVMNTVDDGARFIYRLDKKKGTIFTKDFQVACSREGVSFAGGKKNLCCVTGGLGTSTVTYMGKTYYVCCTGCRDAFNENPAKIIKEFEASKKK